MKTIFAFSAGIIAGSLTIIAAVAYGFTEIHSSPRSNDEEVYVECHEDKKYKLVVVDGLSDDGSMCLATISRVE